jgi:hypothetical protein
MAKRQPINSPSVAIEVMKGAVREIAPPGHVRMADEDWPYWHSVIAEFARSEWTDHQLEVAAFLARTMADMEREQWMLRSEGSTLASERGTPVVNPRKTVVQMHSSSILSLRRSLSLHARAQHGEAEKVGPRRAATKAIEASNPLEDDLLGSTSLQ